MNTRLRVISFLCGFLILIWIIFFMSRGYFADLEPSVRLWLAKVSLYTLLLCGALAMPLHFRMVIASLFLFFFVAEVGLQAQNIYLDYRYPSQRNGAGLWIYDPLLGWKHGSNVETHYTNKHDRFRISVKTNSKGLRDEEYNYEKKEGVSRILLLGDSVTVGLEVERGDLIDVQLENLLAKDGRYEVINAGVQAYGTDQSFLYLKHEGYRYQPDIVIFGAVYNDPTDNVTIHQGRRGYGKPYFVINKNDELEIKGVPVPKFNTEDGWVTVLPEAATHYQGEQAEGEEEAQEGAALFRSVKKDLGHLLMYQWFKFRIDHSDRARDFFTWVGLKEMETTSTKAESLRIYENRITSRILNAMHQVSESIGARFLVYEFSPGVGEKPERPTEVEIICRELGIPYLNLSDRFFERSTGKRIFCHLHDGHWNAKGHRLAAELIDAYLKKERWI
ncbi:MAG: SGNH/GDSL hydrolase family protein [Candidatus Omnitrophica bacterium]|nr:SGNH/GDSL hydrolase family protein [Candidatus Omnitrophota bacterium]